MEGEGAGRDQGATGLREKKKMDRGSEVLGGAREFLQTAPRMT